MLPCAIGIASLVAFVTSGFLSGSVRSSADGAPVPGVLVHLPAARRSAITTADGAYSFRDLEAGRYDLQVSRSGFRPRLLRVLLAAGDSLRIDVALEPLPTPLTPVTVVTHLDEHAHDASGDAAFRELGAHSVFGERLRASPSLGEPDALTSLDAAPGVAFDPERAAAFSVHGGNSDQNLVLLDGAPIFAPYHFGNTFGALNPDALDGLEMHAGVPSASWGGALSSIIDARSRTPDRTRFHSRGAVGATGSRMTLDGPLSTRGGLLLSARQEYPSLFTPRGDDSHVLAESDDLLGKLIADGGDRWGRTEFLFFRSSNALRFPNTASAAATPVATPLPDGGDSLALQPLSVVWHAFLWRSDTYALRWERALTERDHARLRLWHADFVSAGDWRDASQPLTMRSARAGDGLTAQWSRELRTGSLEAGVDVGRQRATYDARSTNDPAASRTAVGATEHSASAFIEHRLAGPRWQTSAGLRATFGTRTGGAFEPRLSLGFRFSPMLSIGAGIARLYQSAQSLRNPESLVSALFAADLPLLAGAPQAPLGRADQLVVELRAEPSRRTRLTIEGYVRSLDGLVLVAPSTSLPFAVAGFATGTGHASGLGLTMERRGDHLSIDASYALGVSTRQTDSMRYHAGLEAQQALVAAVLLKASSRTTLRSTLRAHSGTPTSIVSGAFDWESCDPLNAGCEAAGSPQRMVGSLDAQRLPAYVRLDFGARREWTVQMGGRALVLGTYASVGNVLGRDNLWAYTSNEGATSTRSGVRSRMRSLLAFGADWAF